MKSIRICNSNFKANSQAFVIEKKKYIYIICGKMVYKLLFLRWILFVEMDKFKDPCFFHHHFNTD